nr:hypothetical protein [Tanacetum cinerariifolium]
MDDPNITIEVYIRLDEEKARRHGKVYNWKTATYDKIWYDEDVHDLRSVKIKFPAIVFNDALTSEVALSCEPTVNPHNDNQINFRISFDESDDEDYTIIYDKIHFPIKQFPYFDNFDYFKDFEKEFPAIAYNDALTSKLDFSEPTVSPQHIDEFDETSLSKCDGEEQNVIYFNDLFPFNGVELVSRILMSEIQLKHERADELVMVVVKMVHECRHWIVDYKMVVKEIEDVLLEEIGKFGWWFEQEIDGENEDDNENKLVVVNEEGWIS